MWFCWASIELVLDNIVIVEMSVELRLEIWIKDDKGDMYEVGRASRELELLIPALCHQGF